MIDFDLLAERGKVRNLSGKERGVAGRKRLGLDELDVTDGEIQVRIPEYIDAISPSYFQGLFSQSIKRLNGREAFLRKYRFDASQDQMRWVDIGIRNATSSRAKLI